MMTSIPSGRCCRTISPSCSKSWALFRPRSTPSLSADGHTAYAVPKADLAAHYRRLVGHAAAGEVVLDIDTYPLEQVAEAWQRQTDGAGAKVVVTL